MAAGRVDSVNVGGKRRVGRGITGIDKRPVDHPVEVRAPGGPRGAGSGLAGDVIRNGRYHGGDDQAVYAYAREDLDHWASELDCPLTNGLFGENLTTTGVDVTGAVIGERWRVGTALLEVTRPRVPCATFQVWMGQKGWIKRFTAGNLPGAYLRVLESGVVCAGDPVEMVERPHHGVSVALAFRAMTLEPELLPELLAADALPEALKADVRAAAAT